MKNIANLVIAMLIAKGLYGQPSSAGMEENYRSNVYYLAIEAMIDSDAFSRSVISDDVLIQAEEDLVIPLPGKVRDKDIYYLNDINLRMYMEGKKLDSLPVYEISQVNIVNTTLVIKISLVNFKYEHYDGTDMVLEDNYIYFLQHISSVKMNFTYDCLLSGYKLVAMIKADK